MKVAGKLKPEMRENNTRQKYSQFAQIKTLSLLHFLYVQ